MLSPHPPPPGAAAAVATGGGPRFAIPIELCNIASLILQLSHQLPRSPSSITGIGQVSGARTCADDGVDLTEQCRQIYRYAIRSVQEQISVANRQLKWHTCSQTQIIAQHVPPSSLKPIDQQINTPARRGILANPQDDVLSSVPELFKARQILDETRQKIHVLLLESKKQQQLAPQAKLFTKTMSYNKCRLSALQEEETSSMPSVAVSNHGPKKNPEAVVSASQQITAATIGMYAKPIFIPSSALSNTINQHKPTTPLTDHFSSSTTAHAKSTKISEYMSVIVLYNFALTHHLLAVQAGDLSLLARSADLYDMALEIMSTELENMLQDYASHHHGDVGKGSSTANDNQDQRTNNNASTRQGPKQDPTPVLHPLQEVARTAMGAALTNAGLIYRAFGQTEDVTAVYDVLARLCDVHSRRHQVVAEPSLHGDIKMELEGDDDDSCHHQEVQQADGSTPDTKYRNGQESLHDEEEEEAWDHFFCAAFTLRAGTIAPSA